MDVRRGSRRAAWLLAGTAVVAAVVGLVTDARDGPIGATPSIGLTNGALLCVVALIILDQRPRHVTAWALLTCGSLLSASAFLIAVAIRLPHTDPTDSGAWLAWCALLLSSTAFALGPVLLVLFPAERPPRRRATRRSLLVLAVFGTAAVATAGVAARLVPPPVLVGYHHDYVVPDAAPPGLLVVVAADALVSAVWVVALVALVVRFLRSTGKRRTQLAWAVAGAAMTALLLAPGYALLGPPILQVAAVPLCLGLLIAMRRHQLFGIERLIRRAVLFAALTVGLTGVFVSVAIAVGAMASTLGFGTAWAVAAATFATTMAFAPLRRSLQKVLDRHFDARTWRMVNEVEAMARRLRDGELRIDGIEAELARIVGDPTLRLGYVMPDEGLVRVSGRPFPQEELPGRERRPVDIGGSRVAVVELDETFVRHHPTLVDSVLAAAALCLENASLHARLAVRLADAERSRTRVVESGDRERQRIERDLHDGAQQRLVALALRLRMTQRRLSTRDPATAETLGEWVEEIHRVVDELRALTRGALPRVLTEEGLRIALREISVDLPIPVRLDVTEERFEPSTEATAWFVACEGLTNALKHSAASSITLRVTHVKDTVTVELRDDGLGGAVIRPGGGLQGLADRVAAVQGRFSLQDGVPGTIVHVDLPCAS